MKSMTGFGRTAQQGPATVLDIALRSVNGRYLELRFHLPREYASFESDLKALISKTFSRGTVDIYVNREKAASSDSYEVRVNTEVARKWLEGYRSLGSALNLEAPAKLDHVVRLPEVIQVMGLQEVSESEKEAVLKLMETAVFNCDQERIREGLSLAKELHALCARLTELSDKMEGLKSEANAELESRFRDRLQKLGFEGKVDEQRLAQEIVMQLDRADVSEELSRLREHLKAYQSLLASDEPQGKKLDFYAQELLREVNTIGSKSHIAKLTGYVVEAKTVVEKIREQVQNIE